LALRVTTLLTNLLDENTAEEDDEDVEMSKSNFSLSRAVFSLLISSSDNTCDFNQYLYHIKALKVEDTTFKNENTEL